MGESGTEYDWPVIDRRDYPTGEDEIRIDSDETETLHCEFVLPARIKTIVVYSLACLDPHDPNTGWDVTTIYDLT